MIPLPRVAGAALATAALAAAACTGPEAAVPSAAPAPAAQVTTPPRADSQYLPAVMVRRFRAGVPEHPARFDDGAAASRDALAARYVRALERADTAAFRRMRLTASEFAWLYYLDAPTARPPYELDPDVMWAQIAAQSGRGLSRAVQQFGGRPFGLTGVACKPPAVAGALRLHACEVAGRAVTLPLSIVERDGRFKFVGYGNQL